LVIGTGWAALTVESDDCVLDLLDFDAPTAEMVSAQTPAMANVAETILVMDVDSCFLKEW
jgi:hypothetical protein